MYFSRKKMTYWACLVRPGLKDIFYLKAHSGDIFWGSELRLLDEELMSRIIEKIDVSSEKNFLRLKWYHQKDHQCILR